MTGQYNGEVKDDKMDQHYMADMYLLVEKKDESLQENRLEKSGGSSYGDKEDDGKTDG